MSGGRGTMVEGRLPRRPSAAIKVNRRVELFASRAGPGSRGPPPSTDRQSRPDAIVVHEVDAWVDGHRAKSSWRRALRANGPRDARLNRWNPQETHGSRRSSNAISILPGRTSLRVESLRERGHGLRPGGTQPPFASSPILVGRDRIPRVERVVDDGIDGLRGTRIWRRL
jgi:hypothetical protein